MSKILLVDVDSKIPNLALMKLSAYHKSIGDEVGFNVNDPDKVYASIVFKKHAINPIMLQLQYPDAEIEIGGCGQDLHKTLPEEVEYIKPDYDLYPDMDYSMGFTTRGCIRNCYFCIVPKKEGMIQVNQHPKEFWDEKHEKLLLLDNNVMASPKWFKEVVDWINEHNLKAVFNQGLDARLLTKELAEYTASIVPFDNHTVVFAFDDTKLEPTIRKSVKLLSEAGLNPRGKLMYYVYCHDHDMVDDALYRCNVLKELGTNPFVMCNIDKPRTKRMKDLRRWANKKQLFWSCSF